MSQQRTEAALDVEQEREAQQIFERLGAAFDQERMRMARLMASKGNAQLFGETEYQLRDMVHKLGAKALEVTAEERVKKGGLRTS